jgi:hypothetical protein
VLFVLPLVPMVLSERGVCVLGDCTVSAEFVVVREVVSAVLSAKRPAVAMTLHAERMEA